MGGNDLGLDEYKKIYLEQYKELQESLKSSPRYFDDGLCRLEKIVYDIFVKDEFTNEVQKEIFENCFLDGDSIDRKFLKCIPVSTIKSESLESVSTKTEEKNLLGRLEPVLHEINYDQQRKDFKIFELNYSKKESCAQFIFLVDKDKLHPKLFERHLQIHDLKVFERSKICIVEEQTKMVRNKIIEYMKSSFKDPKRGAKFVTLTLNRFGDQISKEILNFVLRFMKSLHEPGTRIAPRHIRVIIRCKPGDQIDDFDFKSFLDPDLDTSVIERNRRIYRFEDFTLDELRTWLEEQRAVQFISEEKIISEQQIDMIVGYFSSKPAIAPEALITFMRNIV